ncbi:hypothetical protein FFZ99_17490, partial [Leptospira interrogans]
DLGYKGKGHPKDVQAHLSNESRENMTRWERIWMNRKAAIELVIFHLKHNHNMVRNLIENYIIIPT